MNKKNIYLMYGIALLQGMVFYGPIATLYRQAQGVSVMQITIIESISLALCLILELPWGIIADKIGYKHTMMICCGLYFVSKIIFWQADSFGDFLLERLLLSIVIAGLSGVDTSVLYLSCGKNKSQQVFGIYNSLQTSGLMIAALIFSIVVKDDYKMAGFLTVLSYGVAALLSVFINEVHNEDSHHSSVNDFLPLLRQTLKNKYLLVFLISVAFLNETHQTITVFLNQLQYVKCGLSASAIGYIYIGVTLAGLCGVLSMRLTKKFGLTRTAIILYLAAFFSCVIMAFTANPWLSVIAILILRISFSLFQPLQTHLQNNQIVTHNRATALSINAVIIDSVGIGTNVVFGVLADYNLPVAFLLGAGLCGLGAILFAIFARAVIS